jgi:hypothetical protein
VDTYIKICTYEHIKNTEYVHIYINRYPYAYLGVDKDRTDVRNEGELDLIEDLKGALERMEFMPLLPKDSGEAVGCFPWCEGPSLSIS